MDAIKDPYDYIIPYHVSVGGSTNVPFGSGILVKLSICNGSIKFYGILTAFHVALDLINSEQFKNGSICLSKPIDRNGPLCSAICKIGCIYADIDKKHGRALAQNQCSYGHERDVAFILLGINAIPSADLFEISDFYNLDIQENLDLPYSNKDPMVFFRGACNDSEIINQTLKTGICVVNKHEIKKYQQSKILYYKILNENFEPLNGASGAGLWLFYRNPDGAINMVLRGIIVAQEKDYSQLYAIHYSYIYDDFLPKLKNYLNIFIFQNSIKKLLFSKYLRSVKSINLDKKRQMLEILNLQKQPNIKIYKIFTKESNVNYKTDVL